MWAGCDVSERCRQAGPSPNEALTPLGYSTLPGPMPLLLTASSELAHPEQLHNDELRTNTVVSDRS